MKHEVIHLADFLGSERQLYVRRECDLDTFTDAIERYKTAIHTNIENIGSEHFQELRKGMIALKEYYVRRSFFRKPHSWTIEEFRNLIQTYSFFECQILLLEIEHSLQHDNIRFLDTARVLFEGYRNILRARKNELRYELF